MVGLVALALFATTVLQFNSQTTDLSAIRVAAGEVLYRDLWTMYAPGSIYVMALAYRLLGTQMIVGNVLGVLVSAGAVVAVHRLALRVARPVPAAVVALLFALAFLGAGYQNSFASYQGGILFVFLAAGRIAAHAASRRRVDLILGGVFLGAAVLFKHDVGGYACLAAAGAVFTVPAGERRQAVSDIAVLATIVMGMTLAVIALFVAAGAGPAMYDDLVRFPLGDFRYVRPESFPLVPAVVHDVLALDLTVQGARRTAWWVTLHGPSIALLAGVPGVVRGFRAAAPAARRAVVFALAAFPLFWIAAHVQANTHKITMAALGGLVAAAGLSSFGTASLKDRRWVRLAIAGALLVWVPSVMMVRVATFYLTQGNLAFVGLPRLRGIVAGAETVERWRGLAAAIEAAGPPGAPLLLIGRRNDAMIYGGSAPYWLTERPMITPFHELHPAITDTEQGHRRMLTDIATGPMPVVVREHRFNDETVDYWRDEYRRHGVPVGSRLLDAWVAEHYEPGPWPRFGMYEVMQRRNATDTE